MQDSVGFVSSSAGAWGSGGVGARAQRGRTGIGLLGCCLNVVSKGRLWEHFGSLYMARNGRLGLLRPAQRASAPGMPPLRAARHERTA